MQCMGFEGGVAKLLPQNKNCALESPARQISLLTLHKLNNLTDKWACYTITKI